MIFHVLTIFPEMFGETLGCGVIGRAVRQGILEVRLHHLRDYTSDVHRTVDDRPYGGGAGMLLKPEPICLALDALACADGRRPWRILLSAQGRPFRQGDAMRLSTQEELAVICGRYEGVDERVAEHVADEEISIGDYVISGGELAALVIIDAIARLLPGVLGNQESLAGDSLDETGGGSWPQYTRPPEYRGWKVPEVLLQGDHARIAAWRQEQARSKAERRRLQEQR
jgi:tRNA (guanine37-N1)-methyltransferase